LPSAAADRVGVTPRGSSPSNPFDAASALVPGGLSPGTCVRVKGTGEARRTVFIDPGHGGRDPGATGAGSSRRPVVEKTLTLAVALELSRRLSAAGYGVVLARTTDTDVASVRDEDTVQGALKASAVRRDTLARAACANAAKADVLISIHFNAFTDPAVGGVQTVYDDARPFSSDNAALAAAVQGGIVGRFQAGGWRIDDRGVWKDADTGTAALSTEGDYYGHLVELGPAQRGWVDQPSEMPGILVEP
jgi:N-acetylmuramoyl-L-alanine amidase